MKLRKDLVDYVYFGLFGVFLVLFVTGQFTALTGTTLVVIDNSDPNSMFPTHFQGDLFVIHRSAPTDIHLGDVIVYNSPYGGRIIHRVIDIVSKDGTYYFTVKGDDPVTNPIPDGYNAGTLIPFSAVLGKIVSRIPFAGHISLAMQQNVAVQILVYMLAIAIVVAIIFWPDEEEEETEEEKYYNLTKASFMAFLAGSKAAGRKFIHAFTRSKYKFIPWSLVILLVLTGFLPYFLPGIIPMGTDGRGVTNVRVNNSAVLNEGLGSQYDTKFYNVYVTMEDSGNLFSHIEGYSLQVVLNNGTVVGHTEWITLRPIRGQFTVGASIVINLATYNNLVNANNTNLAISIVVHVQGFGSNYDLQPYTTPFVINAQYSS